MAYFQGILPRDRQTAPSPSVAPALMDLIRGSAPVTAGLASDLRRTSGPTGPNDGIAQQQRARWPNSIPQMLGRPSAPSGPGSLTSTLAPVTNRRAPTPAASLVAGLPLPSPTEAGFTAAAAGARAGEAFDSPVASLASSALRAIQAGVPAFRAQRQANREAQYVAGIKAAEAKSYRDWINSDAAEKLFGPNVSAARAMDDATLKEFVAKSAAVQPVTFSQTASGQVIQATGPGAGRIVQSIPTRDVPVGHKVPRTRINADGALETVRDAQGSVLYDDPNPAPEPKPAALTQAALEDRAIRAIAGMEEGEAITEQNRERYTRAVQSYHRLIAPPKSPSATPAPRIVQTDRGIVTVDRDGKVTQLTDATGNPVMPPKSAATIRAQADSALIANLTGSGSPGGGTPQVNDVTARRTANAKAILNGSAPGDKALAKRWLDAHPDD